jgi:glutamyl-tRNA reductase
VTYIVVGANHRTAPLELLERMSVRGDDLPKLLHMLDQGAHSSESVVLSTCNRTEVYMLAERFHGAFGEVRDFFSDLTFLPPDRFADSLYVHYDDQAVGHLFSVAAGLDSAVPGEHEILGQVRTAWDVARDEGTARRGLNMLFRHALEVGKRARTETGISTHVTSVSQAAVLLAAEHLGGLGGRRAVVVGAGSMGRGVASFLASAGVSELVVANRSEDRAIEVVEGLDAPSRAVGLGALPVELATADLLIAATASEHHLLGVDAVAGALPGRSEPLLAVDVALPRDIDPAVGRLEQVHLLDMEDIAELTEKGLAERRREAAAVRRIVDEEVARFAAGVSAREVAPLVTALRERAEAVRAAELERHAARLATLDPAQREVVEAVTRGLVAKLLHDPTVRLKGAAGSARGDRLADSLSELFDL